MGEATKLRDAEKAENAAIVADAEALPPLVFSHRAQVQIWYDLRSLSSFYVHHL